MAGHAHVGHFCWALDDAELVHDRIQGRLGRPVAAGDEAPERVVGCLGGLDVGVDELGRVEQPGQHRVDAVHGPGLVYVPHVLSGLDAVAVAGPLLFAGVLRLDEHVEEVVAPFGSGLLDDGHGIWLVPSGQIEEVGFLPVGVEDGAGFVLERCGVEDGDAAF